MREISAILIEDNENLRNISKRMLDHHNILVLGTYSHQEFITTKPAVSPDTALISFRTNYAFTAYTVTYLKYNYKSTKIALLASSYDNITTKQIESLDIDGMMRIAGDDPGELLSMLETITDGGKYFK